MYQIQKFRHVSLGPAADELTLYDNDISQFTINKRTNTTPSEGTYGDPDIEQLPLGDEHQVTARFAENMGDLTGAWAELWDASEQADKKCYFRCTESAGAVSPTNPAFTGWFRVTDIDAGITVNQLRGQTKTWPAGGIVGPISEES